MMFLPILLAVALSEPVHGLMRRDYIDRPVSMTIEIPTVDPRTLHSFVLKLWRGFDKQSPGFLWRVAGWTDGMSLAQTVRKAAESEAERNAEP